LPGDARAPFANRHAASLRAIYDLAEPERSLFIYQTGQSGVALSSRYADMSAGWADGRYRPLQMAPARWRHSMMLRPQ
ncbi:penicillin acylase family protein, partial [Escherichia coli]|uniref:penicillin acylase family protein n=1 Tax=Escherichia coli TaxID=562 RepID=UPI003CF5C16E